MRLALVATSVFLSLGFQSICPGTTNAAAPTVFTFDANSSHLTASRKPIRAGRPVEVVILHPNSFRESYEIKLETVDYHETSLPELLKSVIWIGSTRLDTLPAQISRAAKVAFNAESTVTAPPGDPLPASLRAPYYNAVECVAKIDLETKVRFQHVMREPLASRLASQVVLAADNAHARKQATAAVEEIHSDWEAASEDGGESSPQDDGAHKAREILDEFEMVTRRWSNEWDEASYAWDRAYAVYTEAKPVSAKADSAAKAANADVQMCKKWVEALKAKVDKVRPDVESFVELACVALDPVRTPDEIRRTAVADGDEVDATITIRRFSLVEEKQKNLPISPPSTIGHKVPVYGRWTLDVSAGFLVTGLRQKNFVTAPSQDSTGTGKVVKVGSQDEADIAPGFFAHYTWASRTGDLSWALGPTLGISTSNPIRYFAGGSLQVGRRARLAFSAGVAWGKLRVLNGETEGAQLRSSPLSVAEVMSRDWGVGVSFAISPRLPGKKT